MGLAGWEVDRGEGKIGRVVGNGRETKWNTMSEVTLRSQNKGTKRDM